MKPLVTILSIAIAIFQIACARSSGQKQGTQKPQPIKPFSEVASLLPIRFENLSTDYLGDIYFSRDLSVIALPVYLEHQPNAEAKAVPCKFKVVGKYKVTPIAEKEAQFTLLYPQIYFGDRQEGLGGEPQRACLDVDPKTIMNRILIGEYDKTAALKADRVSTFNEKIVVFGSKDQQPFPWYSNVFVRSGEVVENADNFFSWYNGTYADTAGSLKIDRERRQVQVNILPAQNHSERVIRAGIVPRAALCHLHFSAPIERVTYNTSASQGYAGMYLWLKRSSLAPAQQECLIQRLSMLNKFVSGDMIAIGIDVPGKDKLRMSFNDMYWLGTLR